MISEVTGNVDYKHQDLSALASLTVSLGMLLSTHASKCQGRQKVSHVASPVAASPEEEEQTGDVVPNLAEAQARSHAQEHSCLLQSKHHTRFSAELVCWHGINTEQHSTA